MTAVVPSERARISAFWCRVPSRANFGDALTPWLTRQITGRRPAFSPADDQRPRYLVTGSVIRHATPQTTVWGAGLMHRDDVISRDARLLAVRGPLTRMRALECGAECPEVYGDPALLLPRFRPTAPRRFAVGVAPHFSDMPRLRASWRPSAAIALIDLQSPVEQVIDAITSCACVISSSLHGIIASHAYGIPAAWVKFRNLPSGDDTKFYDYQLSVGLEPHEPARAEYDAINFEGLCGRAMPAPRIDVEPLWRACPFRG